MFTTRQQIKPCPDFCNEVKTEHLTVDAYMPLDLYLSFLDRGQISIVNQLGKWNMFINNFFWMPLKWKS